MASMEKEFFWGCELNKDKKEYSWDCEDEELSQADIEQKLQLSQACLGSKAKTNEKNLVQVTTTDSSDNSVTFTILSLTSGKTDQCRISLGFPSSVTFKLIEGSGPVHLTGSVYQELYLLNDEGSDEDDEFVKSEEKVATKKRPLTSETPKGPPKKLARVEVEDEEESDDDDDDDDDDDEEGESTEESAKMEVDVKPKQKKPEETPKTAKSKPESKDAKVKKKDEDEEEDEDSEEESDDEDEDESEEDESEEDESDEDDNDEDEEDDESDEEDEIATSLTAKKKQEGKGEQKKPITNGVVKVDKNKQEKSSKTPTQQPSTPKTSAKRDEVKKAGSKTPEPLDMDKLKERLLKTPNLPKKVEKFKNYMKNSYKVTDDSELTKLWDWLKANK